MASSTTSNDQAAAPQHSRVTRDVEPAALRDLLEHPPRGTVAFVHDGAVDVVPARVRFEGDRCRFAICADATSSLADREIVLVVDDGPYWFQLRGVSLRGRAVAAPTGDADGLAWYELAPRRVIAWDYGTVREE
jgi:hypothetical protein